MSGDRKLDPDLKVECPVNSVFAALAGEGPLAEDENELASQPTFDDEGQSIGRQEGGPTIRSHDLGEEGK